MRRVNLLMALISLLTIPVCGTAETEASPPDARWFSIEMIVFEQYLNPSYAEHWPERPELGFPENLVRFPSESRHNSQPEFFRELSFDEATLRPARDKLRRAAGQSVLFYRRWQQGLLDKANAPYIYIRGGERFGQHRELEGSIQVSVERYLHVNLKLWLSRFEEATIVQETFEPNEANLPDALDTMGQDEWSMDMEFEPFQLPTPPFKGSRDYGPDPSIKIVYPLQQERRLRSQETHYIDHPALGILIRIERLENESGPSPDPA